MENRKKSQEYIPLEFQPILWSKNVNDLDIEMDKNYIIHQILSYGNLRQIKWLFNVYKKNELKEVFVKFPKRVYVPAVFYFIKNFVLDLREKRLIEQKYVKILH